MKIMFFLPMVAILSFLIWLTYSSWGWMTSQTAIGFVVGYAIIFYLFLSITIAFVGVIIYSIAKG